MLKSDFFFLAPHHCTALGFPSQCVVPAVQGRTFQDLIDQIAGGRNLRSVKNPFYCSGCIGYCVPGLFYCPAVLCHALRWEGHVGLVSEKWPLILMRSSSSVILLFLKARNSALNNFSILIDTELQIHRES